MARVSSRLGSDGSGVASLARSTGDALRAVAGAKGSPPGAERDWRGGGLCAVVHRAMCKRPAGIVVTSVAPTENRCKGKPTIADPVCKKGSKNTRGGGLRSVPTVSSRPWALGLPCSVASGASECKRRGEGRCQKTRRRPARRDGSVTASCRMAWTRALRGGQRSGRPTPAGSTRRPTG